MQERLARLTGRFKDHKFQDLEYAVQIKLLEVMLDTSIKNRKGVLAYSKTSSTEEVLKLAPWWPTEVPYGAPRALPKNDLVKVFTAVVKHADSTDKLLMRKLEESVGSIGVDMVVQLAIAASMRPLMSDHAGAQRTPEADAGCLHTLASLRVGFSGLSFTLPSIEDSFAPNDGISVYFLSLSTDSSCRC